MNRILQGMGASQGGAEGPVKVVFGKADFDKVNDGNMMHYT